MRELADRLWYRSFVARAGFDDVTAEYYCLEARVAWKHGVSTATARP